MPVTLSSRDAHHREGRAHRAWNGAPAGPRQPRGAPGERADPVQELGRASATPSRSARSRLRGAVRPAGAPCGSASSQPPASRRARGTRPARRARQGRSRGSPARCAWAPRSTKKLSDSNPKAAPESAQTSSSTMSASIAPFAPPAGSMLPSRAAFASVVGRPSGRGPAVGDRLAVARGDHDLAARDCGERQVDDERCRVAAREHGGDRIGAEERTLAAPRGHRRGRVAEREAHEAGDGDRLQVIRRHTEVIAVGDRDVGDAVRARAGDRLEDRERARLEREAAAGVHEARRPAVPGDDRDRRGVRAAVREVTAVLRDARGAVRGDAVHLRRARARAPSPSPWRRWRHCARGRSPSGVRARRRGCGHSWRDERFSGAHAGEAHRFPRGNPRPLLHARVGGSVERARPG